MKIIKRISKTIALLIIYALVGYTYFGSKGVVFDGNKFVISSTAVAENTVIDKKINLQEKFIRVKGAQDAPLTMYMYSSMACSHCKSFHNDTLPKIEEEYVTTGKLKIVFVHFPLDKKSLEISKLSYCLPNDKYYDFISSLYNSTDWLRSKKNDNIYKYAQNHGMTQEQINLCVDDKKLKSDILLLREQAVNELGIRGTPAFVIEGDDGIEVIVGAKKYDEFKKHIESRI